MVAVPPEERGTCSTALGVGCEAAAEAAAGGEGHLQHGDPREVRARDAGEARARPVQGAA